MQLLVPVLVAIFCGLIFGIQVPSNGLLAKTTASPIMAGLMIIGSGAAVMALTVLLTRPKMQPNWMHDVPWYALLGGVYEAIGVTLAAWVAPKLGAGTSLIILVVTQVVIGVSLDHFALLGLERHPISLMRVLGCLAAIGGAILVSLG